MVVGEGEVAAEKLYEAAKKGDATTFEEVVEKDPYLLERVSFACSNKTLLHIATLHGNAEIVAVMLRRKLHLIWKTDSQKSSALHIAAAQGHVEIASMLLSAAPSMCWSRDCRGMNPVHIAAMHGHVEILRVLIRLDPRPARETLECRQTVLHLCVKHRQLGALQFLLTIEALTDLVYAQDYGRETVLHLAARYKQLQMIRYLVESKKVEKQSRNFQGKTALEIILSESDDSDAACSEMKEILEIVETIIQHNKKVERSELRRKLFYEAVIVWCLISTIFIMFSIVFGTPSITHIILVYLMLTVGCCHGFSLDEY